MGYFLLADSHTIVSPVHEVEDAVVEVQIGEFLPRLDCRRPLDDHRLD